MAVVWYVLGLLWGVMWGINLIAGGDTNTRLLYLVLGIVSMIFARQVEADQ